MAEFHSFLWLSNILLCLYHIFFIHLSVDGHLGCFRVLAVVSRAALKIRVHVYFQISVFVSFTFFFFNLFIYLFLAVLGLCFCARAFSSCSKRGPLLLAVRGPLTIAASPAAEHRLQTRRLSSRGSRAQSLRGMWDPPRPGLEPVSPALAGRLPTTAPPGKPCIIYFLFHFIF